MADLANEDKPAIAPPVFVFQKDKTQKVSASITMIKYSDKDETNYFPPVKRERTSSFPPLHSEEKPVGFRLKPPTLIHGQAPSSGLCVPSQKPKEQQRSVLRPAVLQAMYCINHISSTCRNVIVTLADIFAHAFVKFVFHSRSFQKHENEERGPSNVKDEGGTEKEEGDVANSFVFGQNIKDRAKNSTEEKLKDCSPGDCQSEGTNYFLQYISTPSSNNATNSADGGAKFVFGQNMSERVLSPPKGEAPSDDSKEVPEASELPSQEATAEKESLEESAAAYTKATAKKCILEKVDVKTGEESESNVLQMQCKLYVFEKTAQSWIERGRGLLRLNDMASTDDGTLQSRLVMRTQGSLRLILNTKLWPQMQVDKASDKSVRVTATDTEDQGVKVFLISGSSKDVGQLAAALHHRILALKSRAEQEPEAPVTTIPEAEVPQSNEDDSDEEGGASASASAAATTENQTAGST
uniref:Ran-binding protein 3 n=1 Tax=Hippocampus comes TaxID=109280 RepID=A0A3Q3DQI8_HIPCM